MPELLTQVEPSEIAATLSPVQGAMPRALLTDLYELRMAASYLRHGMAESATFSLFARQLPPSRGFLVAAGLEDCLSFIEDFRFEEHEINYLRDVQRMDRRAIDSFRALRFTGDVWAVPEGRIVFANEPLLEVSAPLPQAQLLETFLLNQVTVETALASKAARVRLAAKGTDLVDFSFRRTQGIEAAMMVARVSAMVGFRATSNVEAARTFGLSASGTMAHSYVQAFPTEAAAFRAFAEDYPDDTTFLVDTYDTLAGVQTAVDVIKAQHLQGRLAIRLDSGDLRVLSRRARRLLDDAGLFDVRIIASGGLDELEVAALVHAGAPIDAYGVGTRMGVSADAPYLDTVYKLVVYAGRPVMKLSTGKETLPGAKQVFRQPGLRDAIGLRDEPAPAGAESLLQPVMQAGRRLDPSPSLEDARQRFESDLDALPAHCRRLVDPEPMPVHLTQRLAHLAEQTRAAAGQRRIA
ncbi:MAG TPA: nicotinate phosphoribosyltransferase [Candidatus Limnocylindrales bacterium]|nr:nicotinate phosphoribosyltransferase [Candidatus Limnocylindrales bacterium]